MDDRHIDNKKNQNQLNQAEDHSFLNKQLFIHKLTFIAKKYNIPESYTEQFLNSVLKKHKTDNSKHQKEQRIKNSISDEIKSIQNNASQAQVIQNLINIRNQIVKQLRDVMIKGRSKNSGINLDYVCENISDIRQLSLSIIENLAYWKHKIGSKGQDAYSSQILHNISVDIDFLRLSPLRKYIQFSNSNDPLFLYSLKKFWNLSLSSNYNSRPVIKLFEIDQQLKVRLQNAQHFSKHFQPQAVCSQNFEQDRQQFYATITEQNYNQKYNNNKNQIQLPKLKKSPAKQNDQQKKKRLSTQIANSLKPILLQQKSLLKGRKSIPKQGRSHNKIQKKKSNSIFVEDSDIKQIRQLYKLKQKQKEKEKEKISERKLKEFQNVYQQRGPPKNIINNNSQRFTDQQQNYQVKHNKLHNIRITSSKKRSVTQAVQSFFTAKQSKKISRNINNNKNGDNYQDDHQKRVSSNRGHSGPYHQQQQSYPIQQTKVDSQRQESPLKNNNNSSKTIKIQSNSSQRLKSSVKNQNENNYVESQNEKNDQINNSIVKSPIKWRKSEIQKQQLSQNKVQLSGKFSTLKKNNQQDKTIKGSSPRPKVSGFNFVDFSKDPKQLESDESIEKIFKQKSKGKNNSNDNLKLGQHGRSLHVETQKNNNPNLLYQKDFNENNGKSQPLKKNQVKSKKILQGKSFLEDEGQSEDNEINFINQKKNNEQKKNQRNQIKKVEPSKNIQLKNNKNNQKLISNNDKNNNKKQYEKVQRSDNLKNKNVVKKKQQNSSVISSQNKNQNPQTLNKNQKQTNNQSPSKKMQKQNTVSTDQHLNKKPIENLNTKPIQNLKNEKSLTKMIQNQKDIGKMTVSPKGKGNQKPKINTPLSKASKESQRDDDSSLKQKKQKKTQLNQQKKVEQPQKISQNAQQKDKKNSQIALIKEKNNKEPISTQKKFEKGFNENYPQGITNIPKKYYKANQMPEYQREGRLDSQQQQEQKQEKQEKQEIQQKKQIHKPKKDIKQQEKVNQDQASLFKKNQDKTENANINNQNNQDKNDKKDNDKTDGNSQSNNQNQNNVKTDNNNNKDSIKNSKAQNINPSNNDKKNNEETQKDIKKKLLDGEDLNKDYKDDNGHKEKNNQNNKYKDSQINNLYNLEDNALSGQIKNMPNKTNADSQKNNNLGNLNPNNNNLSVPNNNLSSPNKNLANLNANSNNVNSQNNNLGNLKGNSNNLSSPNNNNLNIQNNNLGNFNENSNNFNSSSNNLVNLNPNNNNLSNSNSNNLGKSNNLGSSNPNTNNLSSQNNHQSNSKNNNLKALNPNTNNLNNLNNQNTNLNSSKNNSLNSSNNSQSNILSSNLSLNNSNITSMNPNLSNSNSTLTNVNNPNLNNTNSTSTNVNNLNPLNITNNPSPNVNNPNLLKSPNSTSTNSNLINANNTQNNANNTNPLSNQNSTSMNPSLSNQNSISTNFNNPNSINPNSSSNHVNNANPLNSQSITSINPNLSNTNSTSTNPNLNNPNSISTNASNPNLNNPSLTSTNPNLNNPNSISTNASNPNNNIVNSNSTKPNLTSPNKNSSSNPNNNLANLINNNINTTNNNANNNLNITKSPNSQIKIQPSLRLSLSSQNNIKTTNPKKQQQKMQSSSQFQNQNKNEKVEQKKIKQQDKQHKSYHSSEDDSNLIQTANNQNKTQPLQDYNKSLKNNSNNNLGTEGKNNQAQKQLSLSSNVENKSNPLIPSSNQIKNADINIDNNINVKKEFIDNNSSKAENIAIKNTDKNNNNQKKQEVELPQGILKKDNKSQKNFNVNSNLQQKLRAASVLQNQKQTSSVNKQQKKSNNKSINKPPSKKSSQKQSLSKKSQKAIKPEDSNSKKNIQISQNKIIQNNDLNKNKNFVELKKQDNIRSSSSMSNKIQSKNVVNSKLTEKQDNQDKISKSSTQSKKKSRKRQQEKKQDSFLIDMKKDKPNDQQIQKSKLFQENQVKNNSSKISDQNSKQEKSNEVSQFIKAQNLFKKCIFQTKSLSSKDLSAFLVKMGVQKIIPEGLSQGFFRNRHICLTLCWLNNQIVSFCISHPILLKNIRYIVIVLFVVISKNMLQYISKLFATTLKYVFFNDPCQRIIYLPKKAPSVDDQAVIDFIKNMKNYHGVVKFGFLAKDKVQTFDEKVHLILRKDLPCKNDELYINLTATSIYIISDINAQINQQIGKFDISTKFKNEIDESFSSQSKQHMSQCLKSFNNPTSLNQYLSSNQMVPFNLQAIPDISPLYLFLKQNINLHSGLKFSVISNLFYFTIQDPFCYYMEHEQIGYTFLMAQDLTHYYLIIDWVFENDKPIDGKKLIAQNIQGKLKSQILISKKQDKGRTITIPAFESKTQIKMSSKNKINEFKSCAKISIGLYWKDYIKGVRLMDEQQIITQYIAPFYAALVRIDKQNRIQFQIGCQVDAYEQLVENESVLQSKR